ncbi:BTB domain-containing protein [Mycena sanguinolenta]|uniref:BTB domain-containing protein n=1 Tax=Mycena sanguinolenta TaxID=230812 RepID=A0A8H6YHY1_9AGAR|nr:BTB domain-containing protein [Mycena sanguinolenta]
MDVDKTPTRDNTPTRVEELWFEDGGLVVQAEQSLFRVSRGILAARSSVFKDMLAFTQPPNAETIDGCPVVRLPDSAEDVKRFFRAIFDSSFFEPHPSKVSFEDVLSIARLSHKYAVEYLLRRALTHLSHDFPMTLSAFDEQGPNTSSTDFHEIRIDWIDVHLAVVQLARKVDALWLLPVAFHQLVQTDEDGISVVLQCTEYDGHDAELSDDDQILFLKFSLLLSRLEIDALDFLHSTDDNPQCTGGTGCSTARLRALVQGHKCIARGVGPLRLSKGWRHGGDIWDGLLQSCCATCFKRLEEAHGQARKDIWDQLPTLCELPPWPELEKMKSDALE